MCICEDITEEVKRMDTTARIVVVMAELIREISFITSDEYLEGRVLPSVVGIEDNIRVRAIRAALAESEAKIKNLKTGNGGD